MLYLLYPRFLSGMLRSQYLSYLAFRVDAEETKLM